MLLYLPLAQVKAGMLGFGVWILMCTVASAWHHFTLPCYQVHAKKYRRARLPRRCRPPDARSVLFPFEKRQCTKPGNRARGKHCAVGCIPHLHIAQRQSKLAKVWLERMPFPRGEIMAWSDRTLLSRVWAKPEPRSVKSLPQGRPFKLWISEKTENYLINLLIFETGTASLRACTPINLKHTDNFPPSLFL